MGRPDAVYLSSDEYTAGQRARHLQPEPESLPEGWAALPCDRPSIDYGTAWLQQSEQLGLILPSAVLSCSTRRIRPAMTSG